LILDPSLFYIVDSEVCKVSKEFSTELSLPKTVSGNNPVDYLRLIPTAFFLPVFLVMMVIALHAHSEAMSRVEQFTEGIDIMLV